MVMMDNYYIHERLMELGRTIDHLHFTYLDMVESPEKIDTRIKLEDCIKDYLCLASHDQKFFLPETAIVLQRSAGSKKGFSGYKAATGWNALQLYAGNLFSQPWRKEYRKVLKYSGFYMHHIDANLANADLMFEALGYKPVGVSTLILDGPICPDRVLSVSRDCLVAYVECQILKAIWEELTPTLTISWLQILEFRNSHLCSPEQSAKVLRNQQKQYQDVSNRGYHQGMSSAVNFPHNHQLPPLNHNNHHLSSSATASSVHMVPQYYYGAPPQNGCCYSNCSTAPAYSQFPAPCPIQYPQHLMKPQFNTNGYYYANGLPPAPINYQPVPTAQLIELESQNGSAGTDTRNAKDTMFRDPYTPGQVVHISGREKLSDRDESHSEDWEYVYKSLERKGYNKDLGERGDVFALNASANNKSKEKSNKEVVKKTKSTNLEEVKNGLAIVAKTLRPNAEKQSRIRKSSECRSITERKISPASSYDNLSETSKKPQASNVISKNKLVVRDKLPVSDGIVSQQAKKVPEKYIQTAKIDIQKYSTSPSLKVASAPSSRLAAPFPKASTAAPLPVSVVDGGLKSDFNRWQCRTCTYLNSVTNDICEICSKTRKNVEKPMEVGGPQCAQCTLVNVKEAKQCEACGYNLKDSPTYI